MRERKSNYTSKSLFIILISQSKLFFLIFKLLILLGQFVICNLNFSQPVIQEWVRRYPDTIPPYSYGGTGYVIITDNKGSIYAAGEVMLNVEYYYYCTIKYNSEGDVKWVKLFAGQQGGHGGRRVQAIAIDKNFNIYVTGFSVEQNNQYKFLTIKYDSSGNECWFRYSNSNIYGGAYAIAIDGSNNIYLTGLQGYSVANFYTIKYNQQGDQLWAKEFGIPNGLGRANAIAIDKNCNVYITGILGDTTDIQAYDAVTISYDSSGNLRWTQSYYRSKGNAIALDENGNVFVTGTVSDSIIDDEDILTIKYTSNGLQEWVKKYTCCQQWQCGNYASSILADKSGNILVVGGGLITPYGAHNIVAIKYTNQGDTIWVKKSYINTGTANSEYTMSIDSFCNIYICGSIPDSTDSLYHHINYFTYKLDSSGTTNWSISYSSCYNRFYSYAEAIAGDNLGNIYVTGYSSVGCSAVWDIATIKYSQPLYGIKKINEEIPQSYKLYQNYPNPFNPTTKIKFDITPSSTTGEGRGEVVKLIIYDILGCKVAALVNKKLLSGEYEVTWDGHNFPSGVYFYQLIADGKIIGTKKLVLLK